MLPSKRLSENRGLKSHPYGFKQPRVNAIRTFPPNCGPLARSDIMSPKPKGTIDSACDPLAIAHISSPSDNNVRFSKSNLPIRQFGHHTDNKNKGEREKVANGGKRAWAIPAVQLRCVPPVCLENDLKSSTPCGKNDDGGKKGAKESENKVCSLDELWKHDSDKLAAIVAEAKGYLDSFQVKHAGKSLDLHRHALTGGMDSEIVQEGKNAHEKSGESQPMDTKIEEENQNHTLTNSDECAPFQDNEPKYCDGNWKRLVNLNIVKREEPQGLMVREVLTLFKKHYNKLVNARKIEPNGGRKNAYIHLKAANSLKIDGKYITPKKPFGHVLGVEIGDEFQFRCQLAMIGLHCQLISGIDYVILNGKKYANSVVDSGRYNNTSKMVDILIYSGQGWNLKSGNTSVNQKLQRGNLALMNSKEMKYPIRVTYKRKSRVGHEHGFVYVYDGLYTINNAWKEKDQTAKFVFRYELHRMPGQPRPHQCARKKMEVCVADDISGGKEKMPIRALNGVDDVRLPPKFFYITHMVYPYWFKKVEPVGCDCVNGCSDSHQCPCLMKNGGEIPYNENGSILRRKPMVHECGHLCKCRPTCMNRVGQHGLRYRLEIFKTERRGWGVRSLDLIPSGGFVCEYLGELLRDNEADLRVGGDEYLFDIYNSRGGRADGFAVDGAVYGNIGRFINHSCSPNLYAQDVLYDHGDKRMPHIMFFAAKDIPPFQELVYDYNYKPGMVHDADGNIKTKACYCGSRECTKRMY